MECKESEKGEKEIQVWREWEGQERGTVMGLTNRRLRVGVGGGGE